MVGYTPTSFTDLDFASKKIEVNLKRGKINHPAWTNEKTGANKEGEKGSVVGIGLGRRGWWKRRRGFMVMAAESPAAMVELESVENWEQCEIVLFLCLRDVCVKRKGLKCGGLKRG